MHIVNERFAKLDDEIDKEARHFFGNHGEANLRVRYEILHGLVELDPMPNPPVKDWLEQYTPRRVLANGDTILGKRVDPADSKIKVGNILETRFNKVMGRLDPGMDDALVHIADSLHYWGTMHRLELTVSGFEFGVRTLAQHVASLHRGNLIAVIQNIDLPDLPPATIDTAGASTVA